MGARVSRVFRNFNLENRVERELSRNKLQAAPRHPDTVPPASELSPEVAEAVKQKNEPLLAHLRSVYVASTEPETAEVSKGALEALEVAPERRPLKYSFPGALRGMDELTDVPKGKVTLVEALKILGGHQHQPKTWTPQKVSQDFSLDPKDVNALLEFFAPFKVEIIPPKQRAARQLKAS